MSLRSWWRGLTAPAGPHRFEPDWCDFLEGRIHFGDCQVPNCPAPRDDRAEVHTHGADRG